MTYLFVIRMGLEPMTPTLKVLCHNLPNLLYISYFRCFNLFIGYA